MKFKAITKIFLSLFVMSGITIYLSAMRAEAKSNEVSSNMAKTVKQFEKVYKLDPDLEKPAVIAVFPFQCEKKLAEKRAGVAVAEILTHELSEAGSFKIVERAELEKILEEQALSLTGVIASNKAIQVGQMLGARLLVMGNINRIGKSYQISARLIDAETSEVIITDLSEVSIAIFEEETAPYLVYVPEKQAIGIYLLINSDPVRLLLEDGIESPYYDYNGNDISVNVGRLAEGEFGAIPYGAGLRYSPYKWLMVDVAYMPNAFKFESKKLGQIYLRDDAGGTFMTFPDFDASVGVSGNILKGTLLGSRSLGKKIKGYAGFGWSINSIKYEVSGDFYQKYQTSSNKYLEVYTRIVDKDDGVQGEEIYYTGEDYWSLEKSEITYSFSEKFFVPFIKLGAEWRPQPRLGVALFGTYNLSKSIGETYYLNIKGTGLEQLAESEVDSSEIFDVTTEFFHMETYNLYTELTVSLYF